MDSGNLIVVYVIYGAVSVGLTIWLARTLFRNGTVFLIDVFHDRPQLADSVNHLLVVGFYMLNLGYAFLILRSNAPTDGVGAAELLIRKLGVLLVSLGVIHFVNMLVFWAIRKREREIAIDAIVPPVPPVPPQAMAPAGG